jgi:hypothetical protein
MKKLAVVFALGLAGCGHNNGNGDGGASGDMTLPPSVEACAEWPQWGGTRDHAGQVCVGGQRPMRFLASVVVDPFAANETAGDGDLRIHYQVPLVVGDDVYALQKSGAFTPPCPIPDAGAEAACVSEDSQTWNETYFSWASGQIVREWTYPTDWKPVPSEIGNSEQMFQPAVSGGYLYIPGLGGTLHKVDRKTGKLVKRLSPFPDPIDVDSYVSGPVVADGNGNVYYNVIKMDHAQPLFNDMTGWLVAVAADDTVKSIVYDTLVTGAPHDQNCHGSFYDSDNPPALPWPPPNDASGNPVLPPSIFCGAQRPGVNVAPAIGKDGTLFTVSRATFSSEDSFIVALNSDLSTKWVTSLRDILNDGCGVNIPLDGDANQHPYDCAPGAKMGVDPTTNQKPAGRVIDDSSGSPVALPDGGVAYGAFTVYNDDRGHTMKFDAGGKFVASFDFGWDYTPAVYTHDGTYSLVVKDNHYRYDNNGVPLGPYYVTQLAGNDMHVEWQYQNTNTNSCFTLSDGTIQCIPDHPNGFEWCINAPAIDKDGTVYVTGEDGVVYAIGQGGVPKGQMFVGMSLGASYTPLSIDHRGRLYTQNDGNIKILGDTF